MLGPQSERSSARPYALTMTGPPVPAPGFQWVRAPWGVQLSADVLAPFTHGWTTRQLQLRGTPHAESIGWETLADAADVSPSALIRARQVHGATVHRASVADLQAHLPPEADILASDDAAIAVAVQVADCIPLLLADKQTGRVAAAHAGWRGTAADVAGEAVSALVSDRSTARNSIDAAIGPSIGPCCYQVGPELIAAFVERGWSSREVERWFQWRGGALYLDLWQANLDQLRRRGILAGRAIASGLCTACHPQWFHSYRRDAASTGRLAAYIRSGSPLNETGLRLHSEETT
jgi:YfiH family protein